MMHSASVPDAFLDSFIGTNDEVKKRCLSPLDFGGELDNEMNDVPLQDQFNRGLVLTQQGRERTNLQLEGGERYRNLRGYSWTWGSRRRKKSRCPRSAVG